MPYVFLLLHYVRKVTSIYCEFIALLNYDQRISGDLSFRKGEHLEIFNNRLVVGMFLIQLVDMDISLEPLPYSSQLLTHDIKLS